MSFDTHQLAPTGLTNELAELLIHEHDSQVVPRLDRLWDYYRNDMLTNELPGRVGRVYRLAQEQGLPTRLRGTSDAAGALPHGARSYGGDSAGTSGGAGGSGDSGGREIVIENDIAWRVHTLVDFMFPKPVDLESCAPDPDRARVIEAFLRKVIELNGGVSFYQDLALLGTVHGFVDVLLRVKGGSGGVGRSIRSDGTDKFTCQWSGEDQALTNEFVSGTPEQSSGGTGCSSTSVKGERLNTGCKQPVPPIQRNTSDSTDPIDLPSLLAQAERFVLETVEAPRAIPVLNPDDYRVLDAYMVHFRQTLNEVEDIGFLGRVRSGLWGGIRGTCPHRQRASVECTEVWTDRSVLTFKGSADRRKLVDESVNRLGRIPIVHIQNLPQPFFYEGLSEVEPLIPLQDELNTRLSDRANRVTFQSFKMYLGKGIEKFTDRPVGPGQMWATDNPDAEIKEFGGDATNPSEDSHINEIREAMDKTSSVSPLAAGVLRGRIGNLSSENALRVTLMGVLARTEKKRVTYGTGVQKLCELILHAADVLGVLPNTPEERKVRLDWPSPIPVNDGERLREAKLKLEVGIPRSRVLAELGYGDCVEEPGGGGGAGVS